MSALRKQAPQVVMGGLEDPAEERAEIEAGHIWREQLYSTIRIFIEGFIMVGPDGTLKKYEACAAALDRRWGTRGRPVSASTLRATLDSDLDGRERNYFRAEWLDWFACRCPDVAELMARRVKPIKTDAELLADLQAEIRETYPKHADQVIRKARTR